MPNELNCLYTESDLSNAFFSDRNKEVIQNNIRYLVYKKSGNNFKIARQSDSELVTIMRSIFFQESRNQLSDINKQVYELNKSVLKFAVNRVLSNVMQHQKYLEDISQEKYTRSIPDRAISVSNRKQLELPKPW